MPMKKYKPEQIVALLRQVEVGLAYGKATPQACKEAETTAQTYYRWRKGFGGLNSIKPDVSRTWSGRTLTDRFATYIAPFSLEFGDHRLRSLL
jgi:hypothetical protein